MLIEIIIMWSWISPMLCVHSFTEHQISIYCTWMNKSTDCSSTLCRDMPSSPSFKNSTECGCHAATNSFLAYSHLLSQLICEPNSGFLPPLSGVWDAPLPPPHTATGMSRRKVLVWLGGWQGDPSSLPTQLRPAVPFPTYNRLLLLVGQSEFVTWRSRQNIANSGQL